MWREPEPILLRMRSLPRFTTSPTDVRAPSPDKVPRCMISQVSIQCDPLKDTETAIEQLRLDWFAFLVLLGGRFDEYSQTPHKDGNPGSASRIRRRKTCLFVAHLQRCT